MYYRARYYNPTIGRFISEDPIRREPNAYAYVKGNPIASWDPWGLCTVTVHCRPTGYPEPSLHCYIITTSGGSGHGAPELYQLTAGPGPGGAMSTWTNTESQITDTFTHDCINCKKQQNVPCFKVDCLLKRTNDFDGRFTYYYKGPNSNSFVTWVLTQCGLPLPVFPDGATGCNFQFH